MTIAFTMGKTQQTRCAKVFSGKYALVTSRELQLHVHMIRWMYSGINVHGFSPIGATGGKMGWWGKTCLRSIGHQINAASRLVWWLTMGKTPNFIQNGSVVTKNDQLSAGRWFFWTQKNRDNRWSFGPRDLSILPDPYRCYKTGTLPVGAGTLRYSGSTLYGNVPQTLCDL